MPQSGDNGSTWQNIKSYIKEEFNNNRVKPVFDHVDIILNAKRIKEHMRKRYCNGKLNRELFRKIFEPFEFTFHTKWYYFFKRRKRYCHATNIFKFYKLTSNNNRVILHNDIASSHFAGQAQSPSNNNCPQRQRLKMATAKLLFEFTYRHHNHLCFRIIGSITITNELNMWEVYWLDIFLLAN